MERARHDQRVGCSFHTGIPMNFEARDPNRIRSSTPLLPLASFVSARWPPETALRLGFESDNSIAIEEIFLPCGKHVSKGLCQFLSAEKCGKGS